MRFIVPEIPNTLQNIYCSCNGTNDMSSIGYYCIVLDTFVRAIDTPEPKKTVPILVRCFPSFLFVRFQQYLSI